MKYLMCITKLLLTCQPGVKFLPGQFPLVFALYRKFCTGFRWKENNDRIRFEVCVTGVTQFLTPIQTSVDSSGPQAIKLAVHRNQQTGLYSGSVWSKAYSRPIYVKHVCKWQKKHCCVLFSFNFCCCHCCQGDFIMDLIFYNLHF